MAPDSFGLSLSRRLFESGALAVIVSAAYVAVGMRVESTHIVPTFGWEPEIPLVPGTVWLYLPGYLALFLFAVSVVRDRVLFRRGLVAFVVVTLVALSLFTWHPVASPVRIAPLGEQEDPTLALLRWLYFNDPSTNAFPSLHVTYVVIWSGMITRCAPRARWIAWALGAAVALSTLTTRQHWLADAVAGAILGAAALWWWRRAP